MIDFNTIYHKYFDALFSTALKSKISHEECEIVVYDTFISFWKNIRKVEIGKERAFLFVTLMNKIKDLKKKKSREKTVYVYRMDVVADEYVAEAYDMDREYLISILPNIIDRLPKKTRRIMQLSLQGYTIAQMCEITGSSAQNIYNQRCAANKVLYEYLKPHL